MMGKTRAARPTTFWTVNSLPDDDIDDVMFADDQGKLDGLLDSLLPKYDEHYAFGLVREWDPQTPLACDSKTARRDATCGPQTREVVSDALRRVIDDVAPDHVQWLPVTLTHRGKPLKWGPYWVANWTRKVDCWNRAAGERLAEEEFRRSGGEPPPAGVQPLVVVDPTRVPEGTEAFIVHGSNWVVITSKLKAAIQRAKLTGWSFDRVPVAPSRDAAGDPAKHLVHLSAAAAAPPASSPIGGRSAPEPSPMSGEEFLRKLVGPNLPVQGGQGASAEQISALEHELGVTLPESYRQFLATCGHADRNHEEIYGIGGRVEAVNETLYMRRWEAMDWPAHMVVVAVDGRGGCYALDTSRLKNGECPVVYFDHELAGIDEETGRITPDFERCKPSFAAWLRAYGKTESFLPY